MINGKQYKAIADRLGEVYRSVKHAASCVSSIANILEAANIDTTKQGQADQYSLLVAAQADIIEYKYGAGLSQLRTVVKNLQGLVLNYYETLEQYYFAAGVTISPDFAELSELFGFAIDDDFIGESTLTQASSSSSSV